MNVSQKVLTCMWKCIHIITLSGFMMLKFMEVSAYFYQKNLDLRKFIIEI